MIKIRPDKYGIFLTSHAAGQGYESERVTILSEIGGKLDVVFEIFSKELQNDFDKQGNPIKEWGYISEINVISNRQNASDYWDIEVISKGTDRENKLVDGVQTYKFSGTKYILLPE